MLPIVVFILSVSSVVLAKGSFCPEKKEILDSENRLHGKILCFEDKEKKLSTGFETYSHGTLDGPLLVINPQSKKKMFEVFYKKGNEHGRETSWENASGELSSEVDYKEGQRHGISKQYREGKLLLSTRYENDKEVGPAERFNEETGLIESREYFKAHIGPYRTRIEFFETGDVKSIVFNKENQHSDIMSLYYNAAGKISRVVCQTPGYLYTLEECVKAIPIPMKQVEQLVKLKGKA